MSKTIKIPPSYKRKILDLEVELAKLKVELKFYNNELQLCKEESRAKEQSKG